MALFLGTAISKEILSISENNLMSVSFMLKAPKTFKIAKGTSHIHRGDIG